MKELCSYFIKNSLNYITGNRNDIANHLKKCLNNNKIYFIERLFKYFFVVTTLSFAIAILINSNILVDIGVPIVLSKAMKCLLFIFSIYAIFNLIFDFINIKMFKVPKDLRTIIKLCNSRKFRKNLINTRKEYKRFIIERCYFYLVDVIIPIIIIMSNALYMFKFRLDNYIFLLILNIINSLLITNYYNNEMSYTFYVSNVSDTINKEEFLNREVIIINDQKYYISNLKNDVLYFDLKYYTLSRSFSLFELRELYLRKAIIMDGITCLKDFMKDYNEDDKEVFKSAISNFKSILKNINDLSNNKLYK